MNRGDGVRINQTKIDILVHTLTNAIKILRFLVDTPQAPTVYYQETNGAKRPEVRCRFCGVQFVDNEDHKDDCLWYQIADLLLYWDSNNSNQRFLDSHLEYQGTRPNFAQMSNDELDCWIADRRGEAPNYTTDLCLAWTLQRELPFWLEILHEPQQQIARRISELWAQEDWQNVQKEQEVQKEKP